MKSTLRQERFILGYMESGNATQAAIEAGYSRKTARFMASENLTKPNIISRLRELRERATSEKVMSVKERKEHLSEIARGYLTDFVELGVDGLRVNPKAPNSAAIQEIHSRIGYGQNGKRSTIHTSVRVHDAIRAIAELNRMDGVYASGKLDITSKGEAINPPMVIQVLDLETKELLLHGERIAHDSPMPALW